MRINSPFIIADSYKLSHADQYPPGTTYVYSNFTPRKCRVPNQEGFVFFGLQAFLNDLNDRFEKTFFGVPEDDAVAAFAEFYFGFFGRDDDRLYERIRALHQLGCLPLRIRALKEGSVAPHRVPVLTVENTHPDFFWVTNFIETWMSCELWHPCTSATTAWYYRKLLDRWATKTSDQEWFVDFQGHDFSMRGQCGIESAAASSAGHALSFKGSDSCVVVPWIKENYPWGGEMLVTSVPATEHSVMCAGGEETEMETFRRLLGLYPTGIVSVVSDTWDFWSVINDMLPTLKNEIMARDGKLVIRPDSSPKTPVEIICGDPDSDLRWERDGLIERLWETFGGTVNSKGYMELDGHIGAIYGDSITLEYAEEICKRLEAKGFASTNIVLGIGSYTYQYVTRDTHGLAFKATAVGTGWAETFDCRPIFKDPKTDNSGKKSAKGLLRVDWTDCGYALTEGCDREECDGGALEDVFVDGKIVRVQSFAGVRETLAGHL